ncbi:3-isopropylmalate dehydratase large subunit, partial [Acinetobacter baumannii]
MIPKSFLIYKNDKLDLCKTLAIIEERLELPSPMEQDDMAGKTLYDKLREDHVVTE